MYIKLIGDWGTATRDRVALKKWADKKITLNQLKTIIAKNNRNSRVLLINDEDFEQWLHSLGWYRNE